MDELDGCKCFICFENCPCVMASGDIYKGNQILILFLFLFLGMNYCDELLNIENSNSDRQIAITKPIIECNSKCRCGMNCRNRLVGKSNNNKIKFEIFETDNKGKGLKALETIKKGNYICKYEGEYITRDEANKRWKIYDKEGLNYILLYREIKYKINNI